MKLTERLRHHVTGAIERGEGVAIAGRPVTTYAIYDSATGERLVNVSVDKPSEIEALSADSHEGHFMAGRCSDIVQAGVHPLMSVYAIIL